MQDLQELLSTMDPQMDPNLHLGFKERTHILCSRFLGGAWKTVSLENFKVLRIKYAWKSLKFCFYFEK